MLNTCNASHGINNNHAYSCGLNLEFTNHCIPVQEIPPKAGANKSPIKLSFD